MQKCTNAGHNNTNGNFLRSHSLAIKRTKLASFRTNVGECIRSFKDEVRNPCTFTRLHISIWLIFVFGLIDDTMWTIRIILRREHCAAAALCNSLTIERPVHMWERRIDLLTFSIWMKATFMSFKFISIRGGSSHHLGNWLAHQASNVYVTIRKSDHWPNCDEYGDAHADDVFAI